MLGRTVDGIMPCEARAHGLGGARWAALERSPQCRRYLRAPRTCFPKSAASGGAVSVARWQRTVGRRRFSSRARGARAGLGKRRLAVQRQVVAWRRSRLTRRRHLRTSLIRFRSSARDTRRRRARQRRRSGGRSRLRASNRRVCRAARCSPAPPHASAQATRTAGCA